MRHVHLASVDLNLLVVLDELLRSQSTVKAAQRLGRTQSAVSHALGRLREIFGDPLFVRAGSAMRPTTFAEELSVPLRAALASVEDLILEARSVEPSRLARTFTISAADFAEVVVLPRLMQRLRKEAPGVDIMVRFSGADVDRAVQSGELDMALGTGFQPLSGLVMQRLFYDRFACVVGADSPRFGASISIDDYLAADHVVVAPRGQPGSLVDDALDRVGKRRSIVMRTPHFMGAVFVVAATDLMATLPSSFIRATALRLPVRVLPLPVDVPPFSFACVYSAARQRDAGHAWLRGRILEICREINAEAAQVGAPGPIINPVDM